MTENDRGQAGPPYAPPPYLSASSMSTYRQCALKFKFNKIDQIPDLPTEATLLGNFVHETLEEFYVLPPDERTIAAARSMAGQVWEKADWPSRIAPYIKPEKDVKLFRWRAWWCIENLWRIEEPQSVQPTGIEEEVFGPIGSVTVKGFIDRFHRDDDRNITISDYKTGKTPNVRYVGDKFTQLKIYATLMKVLELGNPKELELLFLKDGVKFSHQIVDDDIQATVDYVTSTYDAIMASCETGEFPANKSKLCDWCAYKKICPAWKR